MTPIGLRFALGFLVLVFVAAGLPPSREGASASQATPAAAGAAASRVEELLRLVPDPWDERGVATDPPLSYVDLAGQLAAVGLQPPTSWDDADGLAAFVGATGFVTATERLLIAFQYHEPWSDLFGFDVFQVDQALEYGRPPSTLLIMRGRFDTARMRAAWARAGYQELDSVDGAIIASLVPEGGVRLDIEASMVSGGTANNAAILPDGTVVFAPSLAGLRQILDAAAGRAPSFVERPEVVVLLGSLDAPLAGAMFIAGNDLRLQPSGAGVLAVASPGAGSLPSDQLPPVRMALLGSTFGGPVQIRPETGATPLPVSPGQALARMVFAALFDDQTATTAALPVIEERLATGGSSVTGAQYRDLFGDWSLRLAPGDPIVVIDVTPVTPSGIWQVMYHIGDLGFLAW